MIDSKITIPQIGIGGEFVIHAQKPTFRSLRILCESGTPQTTGKGSLDYTGYQNLDSQTLRAA